MNSIITRFIYVFILVLSGCINDNKLDTIKEKEKLLPQLELLANKMKFAQLIPVSARSGEGIEELETAVIDLLPSSAAFFRRTRLPIAVNVSSPQNLSAKN